MVWHAGQQLRVVVAGHFIREPGWHEGFTYESRNPGNHIIHTGGKFDSHLLVPKIPV
jgi:predicted acyl esterase